MRKAFYPKLAFDSLKRNRQIYIPYIFTGIVTIMMYYIFGTIVKNEGLNYLQGAEVVKLILRWTYAITGGFSVVFLFYTNSFLIKRRKKEMGVYQVLGLDKRNLTSMLFWETIYTAVSGIVGGVLLGLVFGKLIFLILLKILHTQVKFSYKILPSLILQTIIFYSIVYLFLFLWNLFQISRLDLVTLLRGENQGEREPKVKRVLALFGVVTIGIGYWIAQTTQTPLSALTNIFFAVILVIIGTYAIFVAGS
ncbi:MAG: ABC transporter permease, partial [Candidatus Ruminococcus intestinipullorum]|nr:ABC transporter permease [Candidatus Ruminococcus intestinipullorum]